MGQGPVLFLIIIEKRATGRNRKYDPGFELQNHQSKDCCIKVSSTNDNTYKQEMILVYTALVMLKANMQVMANVEEWVVTVAFLIFEQQSPISQEESSRGTGEVQQHYQYTVHCYPQEGKKLWQLVEGDDNITLICIPNITALSDWLVYSCHF